MNALNELLTQNLNEAIERARASGRFEIADYLTLKASNDKIRKESVKWLFAAVLEIVFAFNKHGARIKVKQKEKQNFTFKKSRMTGPALQLKRGVRCLNFETGWTQTPGDGIMKGGSLAVAKISHFGFSKQNEELELLRFDNEPQWFLVGKEGRRISFNIKSLRKHFEIFLGE